MTSKDGRGFGPIDGSVDEILPVDDRWRADCIAMLKTMGRTQVELAAHIGCVQANVSQTLAPKVPQKGSAFAHRISMALGVELPIPARALVATIRAMDKNPAALESLVQTIERLGN